MTLFEAIRELKEGQAIVRNSDGWILARREKGNDVLLFQTMVNCNVHIIDLPKPKMTLEEGLEKAAFECLIGKRFDISGPTGYRWTANGIGYPTWSQAVAAAFASVLRSLPIDWQAEADRKEGK